MKIFSLLLLIPFCSLIGLSQLSGSGIIKGTLTDADTQEPLPFVTVALKNSTDSIVGRCTSDFDGLYKVTIVPGVYSVEIRAVDYETKVINGVVINDSKTTLLDVNLKTKNLPQLEEVMIVSYRIAPSRKMRNSKPVGPLYESNTESYDSLPENPFISVDQKAFSTFSVDVDKAGYSNVRRFINDGELPPTEAVRIEEMINYFPYDYRSDNENDPLTVSSVYTECPWNKAHKLLHIGVQAREENFSSAPPNSLVFLIDVSGSMQSPDKLDLLKAGLYELTNQLRPQDQVAIVAYAGASGLILPTTGGANKTAIRDVLESLDAGGSTAGSQGIVQAYEVAKQQFIQGGNNRIILATDGDFNLGVADNDELVKLIEEERKSGVYLSVLGFGQGNLQDNRMEKLADNGNGSYSYIDDLLEAKKVLVDEIGGSLVMVAKDVKLQVQFNPQLVKGYRLIGYENRVLDDADFENDGKDAGDMGSGQTVTALYEIIPADSEEKIAVLPTGAAGSRAPKKADRTLSAKEVASVDVRYKAPAGSVSKLMRTGVKAELQPLSKCSTETQFAAAVAEFGLLLRKSSYQGEASFEQVLELAKAGLSSDKGGYRKAFVELVENASRIVR